MDQSAISVRYAKAFFSLAKEKNMMPRLKRDIQTVAEVCNTSTEFILLLKSPVVKTSKKEQLIETIFKGKVDDLTIRFLRLVTSNKREAYIPAICRNFLKLNREDQNIKTVVLTTASPVEPETADAVKALLGSKLNAQVELSQKVDPAIIGGLILRMEDRQFDASIATQLKKIKQKLLDTNIKE